MRRRRVCRGRWRVARHTHKRAHAHTHTHTHIQTGRQTERQTHYKHTHTPLTHSTVSTPPQKQPVAGPPSHNNREVTPAQSGGGGRVTKRALVARHATCTHVRQAV